MIGSFIGTATIKSQMQDQTHSRPILTVETPQPY